MSIEIDVLKRRRIVADGRKPGCSMRSGRPEGGRRKNWPWAGIVFAHPRPAGAGRGRSGRAWVCHVGIYRREVTWNGRQDAGAGRQIGGVLTRRGRSGRPRICQPSRSMPAIQTLKDGRLQPISHCCFCEPRNAPFLTYGPRLEGRSTARSMRSSRRGRRFVSTPWGRLTVYQPSKRRRHLKGLNRPMAAGPW